MATSSSSKVVAVTKEQLKLPFTPLGKNPPTWIIKSKGTIITIKKGPFRNTGKPELKVPKSKVVAGKPQLDPTITKSISKEVELENKKRLLIFRDPETKARKVSLLSIFQESQYDSEIQHFSAALMVHLVLDGKEAAQAFGRYIDRSGLQQPDFEDSYMQKGLPEKNFYDHMSKVNESNSDGYAMAVDLFRPDGTLFPMHMNKGPWGAELNEGGILVLGLVLVFKEFRRRGLGQTLIDELVNIAEAQEGGVKFVLVKPSPVPSEIEYSVGDKKGDAEDRALAEATAFYRGSGFRRVGKSAWLALSVEEDHPSRKVEMENDLEEDKAFSEF